MAEITYTPIEETDVLNAASLNTPFSNIQNGLNDLPSDAPAPGAFNENHLPSMIAFQQSLKRGGYGTLHTYTSGTYVPISSGGDLEIDLGTTFILGEASGIAGILVFLEVMIVKSVYTSTPTAGLATAKTFTRIALAPTSGAAFAGINRTERYAAYGHQAGGGTHHNGSPSRMCLSTQTLILPSDSATVREVRAEVRVDPSSGVNAQTATLRECWLSVLVLRSTRT